MIAESVGGTCLDNKKCLFQLSLRYQTHFLKGILISGRVCNIRDHSDHYGHSDEGRLEHFPFKTVIAVIAWRVIAFLKYINKQYLTGKQEDTWYFI